MPCVNMNCTRTSQRKNIVKKQQTGCITLLSDWPNKVFRLVTSWLCSVDWMLGSAVGLSVWPGSAEVSLALGVTWKQKTRFRA